VVDLVAKRMNLYACAGWSLGQIEMYDRRVVRAILFNLGNYKSTNFVFIHVVKIIF
jgi:hypothetical protein